MINIAIQTRLWNQNFVARGVKDADWFFVPVYIRTENNPNLHPVIATYYYPQTWILNPESGLFENPHTPRVVEDKKERGILLSMSTLEQEEKKKSTLVYIKRIGINTWKVFNSQNQHIIGAHLKHIPIYLGDYELLQSGEFNYVFPESEAQPG